MPSVTKRYYQFVRNCTLNNEERRQWNRLKWIELLGLTRILSEHHQLTRKEIIIVLITTKKYGNKNVLPGELSAMIFNLSSVALVFCFGL